MSGSVAGQMAYHAGLSAENQIAQDYEIRGFQITERRWRGQGGEIDLIARDRDGLVFVEVKKSRSFRRAAEHLNARQMARICGAAEEYLSSQPAGLSTNVRFDVALVDAAGTFQIIENAFGQV